MKIELETDDNTLYSVAWVVIAITVISIATIIYLTKSNTTNKIADMINHGADPLTVSCALDAYSNKCLVQAAKE